MKRLISICLLLGLGACTHGNCITKKGDGKTASKEVPMAAAATTERVKVYKSDGSLQCGQGKQISLAEMQKELKGIHVYSSINKNDGMMRIQLCGSPTGNHNVYEIDRKDLEAALKAGFKEWTFE